MAASRRQQQARQERVKAFVAEYLKTFNATQAARAAGYRGGSRALAVRGSRLLDDPLVKQAVAAQGRKLESEAQKALALLSSQVADSRADHFLELDPSPDNPSGYRINLQKAERAGALEHVQKIKERQSTYTDPEGGVTVTRTLEVELYNRQTAAAHVLRLHALAEDAGRAKGGGGAAAGEVDVTAAESMRRRTDETLDMLERVMDRWPPELWPPQLRELHRKRVESKVVPPR